MGDVPDHPPAPDPMPGAGPMPSAGTMPSASAMHGSVPAPRLPDEPEWLTQLPVSTGVRSVPAGTGAEVLPRAGSVPAGPRRGRGLMVAAGVLAVVVAGGAAVAVTGTGQPILGRAGPSAGALSGGPGAVPGPGAEASGAAPTGHVPTGVVPTGSGPSDVPTDLPTDLPTDVPTGLPTEVPPDAPIQAPDDALDPPPDPAGGPASGATGAAPLTQLRALRTGDLARLALDGRWVALLASKYPGIRDPYQTDAHGSHVFDAADILAQHLALRRAGALGTRVVLLLSTDYGSRLQVDGRPLWVTLALGNFPSSAAVDAWCAARFPGVTGGALDDVCLPRRLDTPVPIG